MKSGPQEREEDFTCFGGEHTPFQVFSFLRNWLFKLLAIVGTPEAVAYYGEIRLCPERGKGGSF